MTSSNTVISLERCEEPAFTPRKTNVELEDNEILSRTRIKQRRATVAPTELPMVQLPRYLRDPNRYSNGSSRRQSLPVASLNNVLGTANYSQKIPLKLKEKLNEIDNASDEPTCVRFGADQIGQQAISFPLDNRLRDCELESKQNGISSDQEINNSSESKRLFTFQSNSKPKIPQICELKSETRSNDVQIMIGLRPSSLNSKNPGENTTNLTIGNREQPRRHSIAVSVLSDSRRTRAESPLPGMADYGKFESSLYQSKERIIKIEPRDRRLSLNPERKAGHYIPKPDNHLILSIFSFLCCCPLLGLVAILYSVQVDVKYEGGKKEESLYKSKSARCWALMAVFIGMLTILGASMYAVLVLTVLN